MSGKTIVASIIILLVLAVATFGAVGWIDVDWKGPFSGTPDKESYVDSAVNQLETIHKRWCQAGEDKLAAEELMQANESNARELLGPLNPQVIDNIKNDDLKDWCHSIQAVTVLED